MERFASAKERRRSGHWIKRPVGSKDRPAVKVKHARGSVLQIKKEGLTVPAYHKRAPAMRTVRALP